MTISEATAHSFGRMRVEAARGLRSTVPYTMTTDVKTERAPVRTGFMTDKSPPSAEEGGGITKVAQQDDHSVAGGVIGGVIGGVLLGPLGAVAGAVIGSRMGAAPTCTYSIQSNVGCGAQCGAQIRFDITRVTASGSGCPSLQGLRVTESVTTDNGCGPGSVQTGAGCPIGAGGAVAAGCTDTYGLCGPATAFPIGGCTEVYTQQLFVGGQHAETRTITFRISRTSGACSGTVTRT
jgi:hypothetical protein